jgi:glycosyltransferase involved in cell wall biosynthesis
MARTLILSHVSAVESVLSAERDDSSTTDCLYVLIYGRSSGDYPALDGARRIVPPGSGSRARGAGKAASFIRRLRAEGYRKVVIAQPGIERHHARGMLYGFAALLAPGEIRSFDPIGNTWGGRSSVRAGLDGAVWLMIRAISLILMEAVLAPLLATRKIDSGPNATEPAEAASRTCVYLRTDLELVGSELDAGGSASHTVGVVKALAARGWSVVLRSTGRVTGVPIDASQERLPTWSPPNVPKEVAELVSGIRQSFGPKPQDVRLVYQRYSLNNFAGLWLSRRWRVPLILEANNSEVRWREDAGDLSYPRVARHSERLILGGADRVVAVSTNAAAQVETAGAPPARLRVVPNGVDWERFCDPQPVELGFTPGSFVIGFVGLFYPWHGVRFLAEAFAELHTEYPDARLLLVGDGEERPHVEEVLRRGGALSSTWFTGTVKRVEVPRYLAAMDVAVACHAEIADFIGSPVKIFEYMAAGRAIVASRVGQMPELLRDGETALLVRASASAELKRALARLYLDRALLRRLGENARAEAQREHSWDARVRAILE